MLGVGHTGGLAQARPPLGRPCRFMLRDERTRSSSALRTCMSATEPVREGFSVADVLHEHRRKPRQILRKVPLI